MIVMGMMSRKGRSAGYSRKKSGGLLTTFLDTDRDGSIIDDVLSMAVWNIWLDFGSVSHRAGFLFIYC